MDQVKIKKGKCDLGENRILIEESVEGFLRNTLSMMEGSRHHKLVFSLIVFTVSFSVFFFFSYLFIASSEQLFVYTVLMSGLMIVSWVYHNFHGFTSEKFIDLDKLESVRYNSGKKWLTCPRFTLKYEEDGKSKKRLVVMPNHFVPDFEEHIEDLKNYFEEKEVSNNW